MYNFYNGCGTSDYGHKFLFVVLVFVREHTCYHNIKLVFYENNLRESVWRGIKLFLSNFLNISDRPRTTIQAKHHAAKTLSQLNDTNAVQEWSFSKCGFSTCTGSKNKGKHV